ncbi:LOW QUALITY PROTEIN: mas-related G-protein coupled receptor member D [Trichechus inunguis]
MDGLIIASFVFCALAMLTCMWGMVGNSLVIWLLGFHMQWTPFSIYVLSLLVADLLFLLYIASMISLQMIFQELESTNSPYLNKIIPTISILNENMDAYVMMRRVKYFAYMVSLSLLMPISTQHCLSVLFSIWYKCHQPRHLLAVVCALLWALSFLMNSLTFFFCGYMNFNLQKWQIVDMIFPTLHLVIFTAVMTLSSVVLFVQVQRRDQQCCRQPSRLLMVILASVLVFLVCSLLFGIYWFILSWVNLGPHLDILFLSLLCLSSSLSSSTNHFFYFPVGKWRSSNQQEPLGAVLSRVLQDDPELEGNMTSSMRANEVGI